MTIDEALNDEVITVVARDDENWKFRVKLGELSTQIKIVITPRRSGTSYPFQYSISHYLHTPIQAGPYMPSSPFSYSAELTLRKAITDLVAFYKSAIHEGHAPDDSWLVKTSMV